jgi:hypothetical protein
MDHWKDPAKGCKPLLKSLGEFKSLHDCTESLKKILKKLPKELVECDGVLIQSKHLRVLGQHCHWQQAQLAASHSNYEVTPMIGLISMISINHMLVMRSMR